MPGSAAERQSRHIKQLGFDSLTEVSHVDGEAVSFEKQVSIAADGKETVRRSAQPRRKRTKKKDSLPEGIQQATLDELFTLFSGEADIPRSITITESVPLPNPSRQITQLDFFSQEAVPSDDACKVPESKPAGSGIENDLAAIQRSEAQERERTPDGLSERLGESETRTVSARRRRVILDEPAPERSPSRDFRITEAHEVGGGGFHEKAKANIAAIKLLQTLEGEKREALDEEKAVLVRYSGWGALPQVFEPTWHVKQEWRTAATEVRQLLSEEEYESTRATTPNQHFTSPLVITAIWDSLQKLGVQGNIDVLEPAMGVGHFFGLMPEEMRGGHRTGVELDSITARIAKKLYPDSTIFAQGFEETPLPDSYFDLVVGNVPFGDYAVHDPAMKHSLTRRIHDYFFAKAITLCASW
jgi:hypothetical protein